MNVEIVLGNCKPGTKEQRDFHDSKIYWIHEDIKNIKAAFIKLGFHLSEIKRCEIYKIYGYDDFYEFCDNNFHLSSSTVRRHIELFRSFAEFEHGSYSMYIAEKYEKYSYSQLCEMLPLSEEERKQIRPEMTIKEIRDYKSSLKADIVCDVAQVPKLEEPERKEDKFNYDLFSCEINCALSNAANGLYKSAYKKLKYAVDLLSVMVGE